MRYAPVVLFVYNRLTHLSKTVEFLQKNELALESDLFIFSDGPKDTEIDRERVFAVRKYIKTIKGFQNVSIVENAHNQGLAKSVIGGVTNVINRYEKVIVLEDDLETSPDFLRFMNEGLDRYKNEKKVMQISSHMFDVNIKSQTNAIFLPFTTSWGWATWKDAWDCFDSSMLGVEKLKVDRQLQNRFNLDGAYDYFKMLKRQLSGEIDSWAIRWYLSVFMLNGLTLYPSKSLVRNIGFDGSGTHCGVEVNCNIEMSAPFLSLKEMFSFPKVCVDQEAYDIVKLFLSGSGGSQNKKAPVEGRKLFLNKVKNFFCT